VQRTRAVEQQLRVRQEARVLKVQPLLPALPTLVLLGLATNRRVITAVLALAGALLLGPLLTGISIPAWPVLVAGAVSIALGVRLARGLGL